MTEHDMIVMVDGKPERRAIDHYEKAITLFGVDSISRPVPALADNEGAVYGADGTVTIIKC